MKVKELLEGKKKSVPYDYEKIGASIPLKMKTCVAEIIKAANENLPLFKKSGKENDILPYFTELYHAEVLNDGRKVKDVDWQEACEGIEDRIRLNYKKGGDVSSFMNEVEDIIQHMMDGFDKTNESVLEAGKVHTLPKGKTLDPKPFKQPYEDDYVNPATFDPANPKHAKEKARRDQAEAARKEMLKNYNPKNFPVLDSEFSTKLFDPEFVEAMLDDTHTSKKEWSKWDELDQIKVQVDYVSDPRAFKTTKEFDEWVNKRSLFLQSKIKRA